MTAPNRLIWLPWVGVAFLTAGLLAAGIGLLVAGIHGCGFATATGYAG